jgi:RHS repeat-associated protein
VQFVKKNQTPALSLLPFIGTLITQLGLPPSERKTGLQALQVGLSLTPALLPTPSQLTAYAQIIAFGKDNAYLFSDRKLVSKTSENNCSEELVIEYTAQEDGYVLVMTANESANTDVFFDDVTLAYTQALITQETAYGSFGEILYGIGKEGNPDHRWKFNGGKTERIDDLALFWDETFYRSYDMQLGRFWQVDPRPDDGDQESLTTYQFGFDNPIRFNDPLGDVGEEPDPPVSIAGVIANTAQGLAVSGANFMAMTLGLPVRATSGETFGEIGVEMRATNPTAGQALGYLVQDGLDGLNVAGTVLTGGGGKALAVGGGMLLAKTGGKAAINELVQNGKKLVGTLGSEGNPFATSRQARREAMRQAGVPTSQSLIPDKATKSKDKVFLTRDKKYTVQDAKNDGSHQGQPHWEAGRTKANPNNPEGFERSGQGRSMANKPQMRTPKGKSFYNE